MLATDRELPTETLPTVDKRPLNRAEPAAEPEADIDKSRRQCVTKITSINNA